ncbi:hypothetical protein LTR84_009656 [Exophiala bonariae]|uniref:Uncharacterized protein n=1 Tax=Exophiala bonariae TaxID=1690606 RepID=A0AAV9NLC0_9EURO|nr:hypothetical protein LTR84_009656 [Exophiala bonariae]
MRALWSQIPRPRLGASSPLYANDQAVAILVRKTTTAPLKRRLTFNDAFTLLLTPVLATAFVVDTSWKEKQRRDWDKKIAEIQDEIDQFNAREIRILSSLRVQSTSRSLLQQRRHYSVLADPQPWEEQDDGVEDEGNLGAPRWSANDTSHTVNELSVNEILSTYDQEIRDFIPDFEPDDFTSSSEPAKSYSDQEMSAGHRYQRLIATMLAIRLITHFHISTTARLIPDEEESNLHLGTKQIPDIDDIPALVAMNYKLRQELKDLRRASLDLHGLGAQMQRMYRGSLLNMQLVALVQDFKDQKLDPFEFVKGYSTLVLNSDQVPCTETYVKILGALGRAGNHSMAYYVNSALKNSLLPLTDSAVGHMLYHYGQSRDTQQGEMFLRRLIQSGSPYNLATKWQLYQTRNGTIPVPENLNPQLLQLLVYMALRGNQPERAESWYSFLKEINYGGRAMSHLFSSFLYHYALVQHWEKGLVWLQKGILDAIQIASTSLPGLSKVIFRMLDLCVACRKHAEYATILDAAVRAGIPPPQLHKYRRKRFTPRAQSILLEWESLAAAKQDPEDILPRDRAIMFQDMCTLHDSSLLKTISENHQPSGDEDELATTLPTAPTPDTVVPITRSFSTDLVESEEGSDLSNSLLKDEPGPIAEMQKQLDTAHSEFQLTKARAASQMSAIDLLERKQDDLFDRFREFSQKLSPLEPLPAETTALRVDITALKANSTTLKTEFSKLKAKTTILKADTTALKAESAKLKAETTSLKAETTTLKAEIATLKAAIATMKAEILRPRDSPVLEPLTLPTSTQPTAGKPTESEKSPENKPFLSPRMILRKIVALSAELAVAKKTPTPELSLPRKLELAQMRVERKQLQKLLETQRAGKAERRARTPGLGSRTMDIEKGVEAPIDEDTPETPLPATASQPQHDSHEEMPNPSSGATTPPTPSASARPDRQSKKRRPGPAEQYRLDLSNIGHAIPDIKDSTPIGTAGAAEDDADLDNHAVIRRYYDVDLEADK